MATSVFCNVCNKLCDTPDQLSLHKKSPAHLAKEMKIKEFSVSQNSAFSVLGNPGIHQVTQSINGAHVTHLTSEPKFNNLAPGVNEHLFSTKRDPNGEPYIMNGSTGYCFVCEVDLTSKQLCDQHIKGKNHAKKYQLWKSTNGQVASLDAYSANASSSQQMSVDQHSNSFASQYIGTASPFNNFGLEQQQRSESPRNTIFSGVRQCKICKVPFSCDRNAQEHFAGKKHMKEMAMLRYNQQSQEYKNDSDQTQVLKPVTSSIYQHPPMATAAISNDSEFQETPTKVSASNETLMLEKNWGENLTQNNEDKMELLDEKLDRLTVSSDYTSIMDNNLQPWNSLRNSQVNRDVIPETGHPTNRDGIELTTSKDVHSTTSDLGYIFDGQKGYCYACQVDITSNEVAVQHLNGERHRKKLKSYNPQPNTIKPSGDIDVELTRRSESSKMNESLGQIDEKFYHFSLSTCTGFCQACDCELQSQQQADEHISGKPHQRNVELMRLSKLGKMPSLYCKACNMYFTGEVPANQHFNSVKHKLIEELMTCPSYIIPDIENAKMIIDRKGLTWIFCDVCRKPLNTKEQLKTHQKSPGHLTELEKCKTSGNEAVPPMELMSPGPEDSNPTGFNMSHSGIDRSLSSFSERGKELNEMSKSEKDLLTYVQSPVTNAENFQLNPSGMQKGLLNEHASSPVTTLNSPLTLSVQSSERNGDGNFDPDLREGRTNVLSPPTLVSSLNLQGNFGQEGSNQNVLLTPLPSRGLQSQDNYGNRDSAASNDSPSSDRQHNYGSNNVGSSSLYGDMTGSADFIRKPLPRTSRSGSEGFRNLSMDERPSGDLIVEGKEKPEANLNINDSESFLEKRASPRKPEEPPQAASEVMRVGSLYCHFCKSQMNTAEAYQAHLNGNRHRWNMTHTKAENIDDLGSIKKSLAGGCEEILEKGFTVTNTYPRSYQVHLLTKAMSHDSVVYLPTGTGKTLVSVLTMGLMLQENPNRPVIFLVDKVLLVIQQGRYILNELKQKDKVYTRNSIDKQHCTQERDLKMAFVCGGMYHSQGIPLWKHDVIVTTADYCINMLEKGYIRWEHFSLAVLDEVHHCIKKHPYRKLISNYHNRIADPSRRPKLLGLTASPAGKDTVEKTYDMLKQLLVTLGNARIAIVDEDDYFQELKKYQANPKFSSFCVPLTTEEEEFQVDCYRYFLQCYIKFAPMSSLIGSQETALLSFNQLQSNYSDERINMIASNLLKDPEPLIDAYPLIFNATPSRSANQEHFVLLQNHLASFLLSITAIATGLDFKEIERIFDNKEDNQELETAMQLGLPCDNMKQKILRFKTKEKDAVSPMMNRLFKILQDTHYIDWKVENSMALVLVRERKEAHNVSKRLQQTEFVRRGELNVTHLVGHGKGANDIGMQVKQQKRVLDNHKQYNILVATSIAEEGVDICKLGLVVSMNPPNTVRALVQMRGRARKKDSHFVILCSRPEEEEKLNRLMMQETNMMEAAKLCIAEEH